MNKKHEYKNLLPADLYKQIEELYDSFQNIQCEVTGIVSDNKMTDSTAHLEDVIKSTEEATHVILDAATAIQMTVESGKPTAEITAAVIEQVTKIYEACNFQDISGQRIKKVLKHLDMLKENLAMLATCAKSYAVGEVKKAVVKEEGLLNGPQLSAVAPTQEEIDKLFSSFK